MLRKGPAWPPASYDALDRLTGEDLSYTGSDGAPYRGEHAYVYDNVDNRTQETHVQKRNSTVTLSEVTTVSYDDNNRLLQGHAGLL